MASCTVSWGNVRWAMAYSARVGPLPEPALFQSLLVPSHSTFCLGWLGLQEFVLSASATLCNSNHDLPSILLSIDVD